MIYNAKINDLKIILAFMVVGIHAGLLRETSTSASFFLVNGFFRIAVPIFFLLNGYYLGRKIHDATKLKTYFSRLLYLYAFWMLAYLPFYMHSGDVSGAAYVRYLVKMLLIGYHHLWYVSAMILATAIFFAIKDWKSSVLLAIAVILAVVGVVMQYVNYYDFHSMPVWSYRNGIFVALPMMVIGYLIRDGMDSAISNKSLWVCLLLGCAILFFEILVSFNFMQPDRGFDFYVSLIIICPTIFILVLRSKWGDKVPRVTKLATYVYFVHPIVMNLGQDQLGVPRGTMLFLFTVALCLVTFYPITVLADRLLNFFRLGFLNSSKNTKH